MSNIASNKEIDDYFKSPASSTERRGMQSAIDEYLGIMPEENLPENNDDMLDEIIVNLGNENRQPLWSKAKRRHLNIGQPRYAELVQLLQNTLKARKNEKV